jgi:phospholipid-translocating ATPase
MLAAARTLSEEEFEKWRDVFDRASTALKERDAQVEAAFAALEGAGLRVVGVTCVEDRLQRDVAATVGYLLGGGVRVWMLTGDRVETAVNIARSSALIDPSV